MSTEIKRYYAFKSSMNRHQALSQDEFVLLSDIEPFIRDAMRYRWLRESRSARKDGGEWYLDFDNWINANLGEDQVAPDDEEVGISYAQFDAAIDSAMQEQE